MLECSFPLAKSWLCKGRQTVIKLVINKEGIGIPPGKLFIELLFIF